MGEADYPVGAITLRKRRVVSRAAWRDEQEPDRKMRARGRGRLVPRPIHTSQMPVQFPAPGTAIVSKRTLVASYDTQVALGSP